MDDPSSRHLHWGVTLLSGLENNTKTCVFPHYLLCKNYFQHFEYFLESFPKFKAKFDADILLFQVCHLLCIPKLQMEYKSRLCLTRHYSSITYARAFFQTGIVRADFIYT